MSWAIGYSEQHKRWVGYGVPCNCEHPGCRRVIDRGLSYVCGHDIDGGDEGCGMFFCSKHLFLGEKTFLCERCLEKKKPFSLKPERKEWLRHLLRDESWGEWRRQNPAKVAEIRTELLRRKSA